MSVAQKQDRMPGGLDWTWDNSEGFEGHVTKFNFTYLGREEVLMPVMAHTHPYYNPASFLNANDQYYQRRNCHVVKATYKEPINMMDIILYIDPLLYEVCYSINTDTKGQLWLVQNTNRGRSKEWYYLMAGNGWIFDVQRRHGSKANFAFSGGVNMRVEDLTMDAMKKKFLAR